MCAITLIGTQTVRWMINLQHYHNPRFEWIVGLERRRTIRPVCRQLAPQLKVPWKCRPVFGPWRWALRFPQLWWISCRWWSHKEQGPFEGQRDGEVSLWNILKLARQHRSLEPSMGFPQRRERWRLLRTFSKARERKISSSIDAHWEIDINPENCLVTSFAQLFYLVWHFTWKPVLNNLALFFNLMFLIARLTYNLCILYLSYCIAKLQLRLVSQPVCANAVCTRH